MLFRARNGGSIPPRFYKTLQTHITSGALTIQTHTTITHQSFHPLQKTWRLETSPPIPALQTPSPSPSTTVVDYIYYATGIAPNISTLPFLSPLSEKVPVRVVGGMPCLTNDLAWAEGVPLFVAGRLAGLRIGPDCGNLEGARVGAERISWAVLERLEGERRGGCDCAAVEDREGGDEDDDRDGDEGLWRRIGSLNMYESLEGM